jgi:hypothetical protein
VVPLVAGREPLLVVLGREPLLVVLGREPPLVVLGREPPLVVLGREPPLVVLGRDARLVALGRDALLVVLGREAPLERGAARLAELVLVLGRGELDREGAGERLAVSSSDDSPQVPPDSNSCHSAVVRIDMTGAMNSDGASAACEPAHEHPHGCPPDEPEAN